MAAAARVHRRDQLEPGWVGDMAAGAGDGDAPGFERLAQGFERRAVELRNYVAVSPYKEAAGETAADRHFRAIQWRDMFPEREFVGGKFMRYAVWNNKGGVGKTFLSFVLATEIANERKIPVIIVDMCPQANLSEIVLGGNGTGGARLDCLIKDRKTIGGYFDQRINSPHSLTGRETDFLIDAKKINDHLPEGIWLIAGDPSLELQAQVINQISSQTLPVESWKNVHSWVADLVNRCRAHLSIDNSMVLIDCNPSFSAYTELSMVAADAVIVPCSSDGSSARAIDNAGALLYGIMTGADYGAANFSGRAKQFSLKLPSIHSVVLNRSTQYNKKASMAFKAMFDHIRTRVDNLRENVPEHFARFGPHFEDIPDSHSVAIVCSHQGIPLYALTPGRYVVHDSNPKVNKGPLERYKKSVKALIKTI
jgi:cellulose biosynthesis protein BcsQ